MIYDAWHAMHGTSGRKSAARSAIARLPTRSKDLEAVSNVVFVDANAAR
jgi:hypothetical protein